MISCNQCDVKFNYKSHLKIHSRIHTGEKPYKCEKCGKKFKRLQQCKVHIRLGHEKKKIFCPETDCSKGFGTEANLFRHQLAFHLNLKRWICGFCGHCFAQSQDLRRHLSTSHQYAMKTLLYGEKKSLEEIYIVPELKSQDISPDIHKKIRAVYEEELYKVSISSCGLKFKDKLRENNKKPLVINESAQPPTEKAEILYVSDTAAILSENEAVCLYCSSAINNGVALTCDTCLGIFCCFTHLNQHLSEYHPVLYQCYLCQQCYKTKQYCLEHIQKIHNTVYYQKPDAVKPAVLLNCQIPLISSGAYLIDNIPQSLPLQINANQISVPLTNELVDTSVKHVFQTVPLNPPPIVLAQQPIIYFLPSLTCENPPQIQLDSASYNSSRNAILSVKAALAADSFLDEKFQGVVVNNSEIIAIHIGDADEAVDDAYSHKTITIVSSDGSRDRHQGTADDEKIFVISQRNYCDKSLKSRKSTNSVKWENLSTRAAGCSAFRCDTCNKEFSSSYKCHRHAKIHKAHKYICEICDKTFAEKHNLKTHILMHTQEKPQSCNRCGKKYRYARDLKDHLLTHDGLLPFSCQHCDSQFLRKRDLIRHKREQHLLISYKCQVCGRKFKRKDYLEKTHMAAHTNPDLAKITKLICKFCNMVFKTKEEKLHHSCSVGPKVECELCTKKIQKKQSFLLSENS